MPRNVEIKARVQDAEAVKTKILDLIGCSGGEETVLSQEDVFFNLPADKPGRLLKLRKAQGVSPELIYYDREETTGPKLSSYDKCEVPANLESVLTSALGTWGVVKKVRTLIMVGQTRVHFDSVEGLGNFVELEVILNDSQTIEDGQKIAMDLMSLMGVKDTDLIPVSYSNLLFKTKNKS